MNRKIKFRAWDKTFKKMYYQDRPEKAWWWDSDEHSIKFPLDSPCENLDGKIEIQQFTGLLDKNGKEIWEGDVVEKRGHNSSNLYNYVVTWKQKWNCYFMSIAQKTKGYLEFYPSLESGEEFTHGTTHSIEIVGNIYENPELVPNLSHSEKSPSEPSDK